MTRNSDLSFMGAATSAPDVFVGDLLKEVLVQLAQTFSTVKSF
jgi:hypothetical protein|tara:strand:+ start:334 stop:462 length:129 start_codon:yes stop_codon:yes gene_type:complete